MRTCKHGVMQLTLEEHFVMQESFVMVRIIDGIVMVRIIDGIVMVRIIDGIFIIGKNY